MTILGMTPFLLFHVAVSIVALAAGIVVVLGLIRGRGLPVWTAIYLVTAVLTSATGFGLPAPGFLPSHGVGVLTLVLLLVAILARYVFKLAGSARWLYAVSLVLTVYFDAFVGVVQTFQKVPPIHALAPTQAEPPFAITQGVLLVIFIVLAIVGALRFRPAAV